MCSLFPVMGNLGSVVGVSLGGGGCVMGVLSFFVPFNGDQGKPSGPRRNVLLGSRSEWAPTPSVFQYEGVGLPRGRWAGFFAGVGGFFPPLVWTSFLVVEGPVLSRATSLTFSGFPWGRTSSQQA